jgi:hypothetical protein
VLAIENHDNHDIHDRLTIPPRFLVRREPVNIAAEQLAEAHEAIAVARKRYPTLVPNGFAQPRHILGYDDRPGDKHDPREVATAIAYLGRCARTRSANYNSYGLKHGAEDWGDRNDMSPYVSNGALIVAAVYLGLKVVPDPGTPNAAIGVSSRSVEWLRRSPGNPKLPGRGTGHVTQTSRPLGTPWTTSK